MVSGVMVYFIDRTIQTTNNDFAEHAWSWHVTFFLSTDFDILADRTFATQSSQYDSIPSNSHLKI